MLEPSDEPGVLASAFGADGSFHKCWGIYAGGTAEPVSADAIAQGRHQVRLVDRLPSSVNDEGWPKLLRQLADNGGFAVEDLDFVIFTQVKQITIEKVMQELGLPLSKTHLTMQKWGYTGSACVPIAFDDAIEQNKIRPGDLVALVGSGVGYNQAAVALRL